MTALTEYDRLESTGLWREDPDAQRREVVVSLGDATLTLSGHDDLAIAHWSLPAVTRINPGETPALYAPGPDALETLEVEGEDMQAALDKVIGVLERRRARPGRLRLAIILGALIAVGGIAWTKLPETLETYTLRVVPEPKRAEIGQMVLARLTRVTGLPCRTPLGEAALFSLEDKVSPGPGGQFIVVPSGVGKTRHLPGQITLIDRTLVEDHEDPSVLAGHLLAEGIRREAADPLQPLLAHAGFMATFQLYTRGTIPPEAVDGYAEEMLKAAQTIPSNEVLLSRFDAAGVPSTPFAYDVDPSGESTLALIEADPYPQGAEDPVLPDGAWVALQEICSG